jgi:hypothetical protein
LIEAFAFAAASDRARVAAKLNPDAAGILRTFSFYAPVVAVRRNSPELIKQGLTTTAILGEIDDVRDLTFYLATIYHSAAKLGIDARKVFGEVAALTPSIYLERQMREFPLRSPKERALTAFGFRETLTAGEFDLVQNSD